MQKKETIFEMLMASSQVTISGFADESGCTEKRVHRAIREVFLKSMKYMEAAAEDIELADVHLVFQNFKGKGDEGRRAAFDLIIEHRPTIREGFLRAEREQETSAAFRQNINANLHPLSVEDIDAFNELQRLPIHPSMKPALSIPIPMGGDPVLLAEEIAALLVDVLPKTELAMLRDINGASRRRFREWLAERGLAFLGDSFCPDKENQRKIESSIRLLERSGYVVQKAA